MRILYVVQHFSGPSGWGSSRAFENARRLVRMGHSVVLLCGTFDKAVPEDIDHARNAGIEIYRAPVLYSQRLPYLGRLVAFRRYMGWAVRTGKSLPRPDIVFASSTPLTVGEIGRKVALHHRAPFVFEVRDLWPELPMSVGALKNPVLRHMACRMARRVYDAADHVVALSPDMKQGVAAWGVPEDRITVIPNCSDTALFGSRNGRDEERKRLGWDGKLVCLYSGVLGKMNNLDYLLDAAKELDRAGVDDVLIAIMGSGGERQRLAQRIETENLRAVRLYDPVPKSEMHRPLAAADVGVVSLLPMDCLEGSSPNKFFDFLAAGLPVVVNFDGWLADALRESRAGTQVDPYGPGELGLLLMALRDDPARRQRLGEAARKLAEERFDRDKLVTVLESTLRQVHESRLRELGR